MSLTLRTALRLGRVSNLPTVWTNVLAGLALNGGALTVGTVLPLGVAASLFYVAGMYLNDAFDARWDARFRPERPIPAGEISARTVFALGLGMMVGGLVLLALTQPTRDPAMAGAALCGLIVLYDASHKGNPFAPVVMGLCRVAVYLMAALAAAPVLAGRVYVGAAALLVYLIGLTALARREAVDPRIPPWIGRLIAGISLLDAAILLLLRKELPCLLAVGAFFLTRRLQRRVPGT